MVAIPVTNDQPSVAARIAWTGTGVVLPLKRLNATRLKEKVETVLRNDSYREAGPGNASPNRGSQWTPHSCRHH
jgi:UDP:flavonoid glycosyltransferase YjiC (YdhE family)